MQNADRRARTVVPRFLLLLLLLLLQKYTFWVALSH